MSASISTAQTPHTINATQTANASTSPAPGSSSTVAAGSAQPTARSYANATKKQPLASPPIASSAAPPVAVGGPAQQHGKSSSISPVNGKNSIQPAVPAVGPTIVSSGGGANGAPSQVDHSRKPSVTMSATGPSGYIPNGGPVVSSNRAPLTFGSIPAGGSPAPSNSSPHHSQASLGTPGMNNPRITSPAASPSPIPQATSGGRPPSELRSQGITFGGMGGEAEPNSRPLSMPPQPVPMPQAQHLRRESSQSAHSESNQSMNNMNRGYPPNGGRGRGYSPAYGAQMGHSPGPGYRPLPNQQRGAQNMPQHFQPQGPMGVQPNSPYRGTRSPHITPATMQSQAHLANNPQMQYSPYGHPPHLNPQPVGSPSLPSSTTTAGHSSNFHSSGNSPNTSFSSASATVPFHSPNSQHNSFLRTIQFPNLSPANGGFEQYLTLMKSQGMYGMAQPGFDPNYGYYPQQFQMHQQMYPGAAPPSPRTNYPPQMAAQPFMPGGYGNPPHAQSMSRTPSQVSERPPSTLAQPQTPSMSNVNHVSHAHTPSASSASPAPSSSNFTIPPKKTSKAIVIKNAEGKVVEFDKKAASPAPPAQPRSPAIASTPTPPPRAPSATESLHSRTESSVDTKSAADRKQEFMEQFQKNLLADKAKEEADKKAAQEKESQAKADAEAKAAKEKEEAELKIAKEKEEAEKAKKAEEEKEAAKKAADDEAEKKRLAEEEEERMIAEMEALEREEEERERAYAEKKAKEAEERKKKEAANAEEELRRQEKEAEEREEAREKERAAGTEETAEQKAEREALFASLKKNTTLGPGAAMADASESGASTPTAEPTTQPASQTTQPRITSAGKPKPAALKLETNKPVEPAQPTAGMQALKSARFLQVKNESIIYPEGIKSPNPALNQGGRNKGRQYDKDFLLQFQEVFKEKPSMDWDMKLKETVGDSSDSARPQSARTPSMGGMGGRQPSRGGLPGVGLGGAMGSFSSVGGRTIRPGTTSQERFEASNMGARPPTMNNPLAQLVNRPGGFPMGAPQMSRTGSFPNMAQTGPNSPRNPSHRGKNSSRRGPDRAQSKREEEQAAKTMPLTAGMDLKPLEVSQTGWKPTNIGKPPQQQQAPGHMPPDMVQRKVKAALNKMTPEKFDKIADQILEIAAQSKDESDGVTLRQVIQLTFEKACDEAHWASMYAKFCKRMLETMSAEIKDENVKDKSGNPVVGGALFRKYLLNRCQEEFERGWEVNLPEKPEGQTDEAAMLSDEYYIAAAAKRKGLGLIQFIGELYKLGMLTLRIMHECVLKLLDFEGMPDESAIESLVKLLRTVGATMENTEAGPKMIGMYFERVQKIMAMEGLPSRMHFMLLDTVELRRKGWKSKDDAKGPKTIQEIHAEALAAQQQAELERSRNSQRGGPRPQMGRGDARSFSGGGMMPPPEYPRDRVQMDDLRKLTKGTSGRNLSNSPAQLGPSSLFGGRSGSGRKGLGPGMMRGGEESGASSRTATPPQQKEKESATHVNSFSALAALDASGEGAGDVGSPPSTASSPPVSKSMPVRSKSPAVEAKKEDGAKPSES